MLLGQCRNQSWKVGAETEAGQEYLLARLPEKQCWWLDYCQETGRESGLPVDRWPRALGNVMHITNAVCLVEWLATARVTEATELVEGREPKAARATEPVQASSKA